VLSACHTAADDGSGETLSGLARAFFHAGAAARLVSQWSVDDVATRVLRTEVFRRQAKAPGLVRAVMTRAQGRTAYFTHPYAWAPSILVGDGGRGRPLRVLAGLPSCDLNRSNTRLVQLLVVCRLFRQNATAAYPS
jgi:hypothetical protein